MSPSSDTPEQNFKHRRTPRFRAFFAELKTISEFLSDAMDAVHPFREGIQKSIPWAHYVLDLTGDAIPPAKFLAKLCENLGQIDDPTELGQIACVLAFQSTVAEVLASIVGPVDEKYVITEVKEQLRLLEPCEEVNFESFSLENALDHEFFKRAELSLQTALILVGYGTEEIHRITHLVKDGFVGSLKELLVRKETADRFSPFKEYLQLKTGLERLSYRALAEHARFQRWLFEEAAVLGRSPFALQDVYVETDCVEFSWGTLNPREAQPDTRFISDRLRRVRTREALFSTEEASEDEQPDVETASHQAKSSVHLYDEKVRRIVGTVSESNEQRIDPFSERSGKREPLLNAVMDLIADWRLSEPIVIQGVAGIGKSTFTLRLCIELQKNHLRPILVRFKDLRFDKHISESLPQAVRLSNNQRSPDLIAPTPADLFNGGRIFIESGTGKYSRISRYVLIIDGWDEISTSNEGFRQRLETLLSQLRSEYIANSTISLPIRLVLTGRPSMDLNGSGFLRDNTPIVTIRPFTPEQLSRFFKKVSRAVNEGRLTPHHEDYWTEFDVTKAREILRKYESEFGKYQYGFQYSLQNPSFGVLGLPLLAHLATRLISAWDDDPEIIIGNATALYRNLVNLTCKRAGKAETDASSDETREQNRIRGNELRALLWQTASAMTVHGQDIIPYEELSKRLKLEGSELDRRVSDTTKSYSLASLLISFYFKGGFRHTGCEFAHKSFREYLFAESLIEILKEYGSQAPAHLPERTPYWRDFSEDDPRLEFSCELSKELAPQWLRREVIFHLEALVEWEILRAAGLAKRPEAGSTTKGISLDQWRKIRDGLADLWDWWAEGVHLRPQPHFGKRRELVYRPPWVLDLVETALPFDLHFDPPTPARTTTMDSHLGYGLLVLCVMVHYHMSTITNVQNPIDQSSGELRSSLRKYQSLSALRSGEVRFAPSGPTSDYFANYLHRICAAGIHSTERFPRNIDLRGVDLSSANLENIQFEGARLNNSVLNRAVLTGTNLSRATLTEAFLNGAKLNMCNLCEARLNQVRAYGTDFESANLENAYIDRAILVNANLNRAQLNHASLDHTSLSGVTLEDASLVEARLDGARLEGASLMRAKLDRARLYGARLYEVRLDYASLEEARLIGSIIEGGTFTKTNFANAMFDKAVLRELNLSDAFGITEEQLAKAKASLISDPTSQ